MLSALCGLALLGGPTDAQAAPRDYLKVVCHTQGAPDVSASIPLLRGNDGSWFAEFRPIQVGGMPVIVLFTARQSEIRGLLHVDQIGFASQPAPGEVRSYGAFGLNPPGSLFIRPGAYVGVATNTVRDGVLDRYDYCAISANIG